RGMGLPRRDRRRHGCRRRGYMDVLAPCPGLGKAIPRRPARERAVRCCFAQRKRARYLRARGAPLREGAEGGVGGEGGGVAADGLAFLRTPRPQRRREGRLGDPVAAVHESGQEAAGKLVLALRTRLETGEALRKAVLDALVIAGLEVQS